MFSQSFFVTLAVVFGILLTLYFFSNVLLDYVIVQLAKWDSWFSPIRTKPPEGTIQPVMHISSNGKLAEMLHSVPGKRWVASLLPSGQYHFENGDEAPDSSSRFDRLGVVWGGFFKKLYNRPLDADTYARDTAGTEWTIQPRKREESYVFFQMTLGLPLEFISKGNVRVKLEILFTIEFWRPVIAFFLVGGWLKFIVGAITETCREFVGVKDADTLREEFDTDGSTDLVDKIVQLTKGRKGLLALAGVKLTVARFVDYDFSMEGQEDLVAAYRNVEIARQGAKAAVHDKRKRILLGEGDAQAVKRMIDLGEDAIVLAQAYALRDGISNASTVLFGGGGNNPIAIPLPDTKGKKSVGTP